jgi:hypothetical protein
MRGMQVLKALGAGCISSGSRGRKAEAAWDDDLSGSNITPLKQLNLDYYHCNVVNSISTLKLDLLTKLSSIIPKGGA